MQPAFRDIGGYAVWRGEAKLVLVLVIELRR
jgi:hypothetical protein